MGRPSIRVHTSCAVCGQIISHKPSKPFRHCSPECRQVTYAPLRLTVTCGNCCKVFTCKKSEARKFCSNECYNASRSGEKAAATCALCGIEFSYMVAQHGERRFCSRDCYRKANWDGKSTASVCVTCGSEFQNPSYRPRQHCSDDCYNTKRAANYVTKPCPYCHRNFTCKADRPHIHCSRSCQRKAKQRDIAITQELVHNNPVRHWRKEHPYYGISWHQARRAARERDKVCVDCGITPDELGRELSVHHLKPFLDFGLLRHEEANDLANLVCLCNSCHAKREGWSDFSAATII